MEPCFYCGVESFKHEEGCPCRGDSPRPDSARLFQDGMDDAVHHIFGTNPLHPSNKSYMMGWKKAKAEAETNVSQ